MGRNRSYKEARTVPEVNDRQDKSNIILSRDIKVYITSAARVLILDIAIVRDVGPLNRVCVG